MERDVQIMLIGGVVISIIIITLFISDHINQQFQIECIKNGGTIVKNDCVKD